MKEEPPDEPIAEGLGSTEQRVVMWAHFGVGKILRKKLSESNKSNNIVGISKKDSERWLGS